jgi:hypothetical protein
MWHTNVEISSVAGAIWRSTLPKKLTEHLPTEYKSQAQAIFGSIVVAQKYEVGSPAREAIDLSYRQSQRLLGIAALAALAPMLIIMFLLENVTLDERMAARDNKREEVKKVEEDSESKQDERGEGEKGQ